MRSVLAFVVAALLILAVGATARSFEQHATPTSSAGGDGGGTCCIDDE